jgi:hypothetical protein
MKVHCCIHNSSSLVTAMSQIYMVFDLLFCLVKIHFNIVVLSGPILLRASFHSDLKVCQPRCAVN